MCDMRMLSDINKSVVDGVLGIDKAAVYKVILFGSYARNEATDESDIDYMVIFDKPQSDLKSLRKQILNISERVSYDNDVVVSILVRDKESFELQKHVLPLYKNIAREGILLYG
ncbi:MAG: nucleotidyltransferase domain-containing protein [Anaerovibrio sp.]